MMTMEQIDAICPGWSGISQWKFFDATLRDGMDVLVLGVYLGRDISYMANLKKNLRIVGIDKFSAEPCADWPEEKRGMSWREAFGCEPPSREQASIKLEQCDTFPFLISSNEAALDHIHASFDFIYIDTSHDYQTTARTIKLALPRLRKGGIIAGDDYSDMGTWGVARAVKELLPVHTVHYGTIWEARP